MPDGIGAEGPMWLTSGELTVLTEDEHGKEYSIQWYPDKNNDSLDTKVYYYQLDQPRLATDPDGDYKFHLTKFQAALDEEGQSDREGQAAVGGGYLTLSTTLQPPEDVLADAKEELRDRVESRNVRSPLLRWASSDQEVSFRSMPLVENKTRIDAVSASERDLTEEDEEKLESEDPPRWGWDLQGEEGTLNPLAESSFSAMLGRYPATLIDGSARSGTSNLVVRNDVKHPVHVPVEKIKIHGNWESIYDHFSAAFSTNRLLDSIEISGELEKMEQNGVITVEITHNEAHVDSDSINKWEEHADEIVERFMTQAEDTIFDREEPDTESAEASGFFGSTFSLKATRDEATMDLRYEREINRIVEKTNYLDSSIQGLFDELQEDETAEERYFSDVYLDEDFGTIDVIAASRANWDDPIERMRVSIGYPEENGVIDWRARARYQHSEGGEMSTDSKPAVWREDLADRLYHWAFNQHDDIEGREPEEIDVKKYISYQPDNRVFVDEIEEEWRTTDPFLEISAEAAGRFEAGPMTLGTRINHDNYTILVTFRNGDTQERFEFTSDNQDEDRYWRLWYPSEEEIPSYEYKVECVVQSQQIGRSAIRWESDWKKRDGGGELMIEVPEAPEDKLEEINQRFG